MFPQTANVLSNPYDYNQLIPYTISPPFQAPKTAPAGGKTLPIMAAIIATMILIGMALGLGLGIGAAGLIGNLQLVNVTNTTTGR